VVIGLEMLGHQIPQVVVVGVAVDQDHGGSAGSTALLDGQG
jgi:hypothetical protein